MAGESGPFFMLGNQVYSQNRVNKFYKKRCQEKSSASTGGEISFSRSSPLKFRFSGEAWPIAHAHKFPLRRVAMPSSSREWQARRVLKVNHGSIRGSWPMAISGSPRGHNV
jgi:hypothetical protein